MAVPAVQHAPTLVVASAPARPRASLLFYSVTIISLNLLWGYAQERVGTQQFCAGDAECEVFREIPCMNLLQSLLATVVAYLCIWYKGASFQRVGHPLDLLPPAITHTIASPVGYLGMGYIPFPLYILVSSCKLIPVLLVGVLLNPADPRPLQDFFSALIMTEGVLLYSSAQLGAKASESTDAQEFFSTFLGLPVSGLLQVCVGVGLTLGNLFLEGFTNASQDRVNLRHRAAGRRTIPSLQMMADMNLFSFLLLLGFLGGQYAWLGQASYLARGLAFAARHPQVLQYIGTFALSGSIAQIFIFACLEEYGGFQTTSICTARKILSVLLSVFLFSHKLDFVQCMGILNVSAFLAGAAGCRLEAGLLRTWHSKH